MNEAHQLVFAATQSHGSAAILALAEEVISLRGQLAEKEAQLAQSVTQLSATANALTQARGSAALAKQQEQLRQAQVGDTRHTRIFIDTSESGFCKAVLRVDDQGKVLSVLWQAPQASRQDVRLEAALVLDWMGDHDVVLPRRAFDALVDTVAGNLQGRPVAAAKEPVRRPMRHPLDFLFQPRMQVSVPV